VVGSEYAYLEALGLVLSVIISFQDEEGIEAGHHLTENRASGAFYSLAWT
jgi:hypothetical protein